MKTIIAGSRDADFGDTIKAIYMSELDEMITEVVCGGARGADSHGETWAKLMGVPIKRFPADWGKHGRSAGYIRNADMAAYADALVAVWDGKSRGTKHMIELARKAGLAVYTYLYHDDARQRPF